MSSGSGRHQHNSSSSSSWSPSRHHSNQQPPSPASINNVPRSTFVPEIVIPRRTSSSSSPSLAAAAHSPSAPAGGGAAYSAGSGSASGLLRPPSQQARYAQGNGPSSASSTGGAYATHYSNNSGTGRYGTGASGSYASAYDGSAPAPGGSSAPTASHEDSLTDVMGSAGVDLRAEEEAMQSQTRYGAHSHHQTASNNHAYASGSSQPKRSSGGLFLEVYPLSMKVHSIAAMHGLGVEPDVLNYLSLTARTRFRNLAEAMIAAARHRIWSTAHARPPPLYPAEDPSEEPKPMYHEQLISDPTKQLSAIEKAEREEEARARRRRAARVEREAAEQAFLAALLEEEKSGRGTGGGAASSSKNAMEGVVNGDGSKKAGQVSNGSHAAGSDKKGGNAGGTSSSTGNAEAGSKSKKSKAGADGAAGGGKDGPSDGPKKKKQKKNPAGAAAGTDGAASGAVAGASGTTGTGTRVSKKYNLSEDVQKRLTDSTATQLIGGKAYGWMSGSAGGAGAGGKGKKGAKEPVKSKLPAPRFGSDSAKKAGGIEDGDGDYEEEGGAGGSSRARGSKKDVTPVLPPSSKRTDSNSSPSKPHNASGSGSVGAWGDVAARKAAREEADRQRRLRVQMRDALFVLEEEVAGGVQGRGAGANALMKARAKMGVVMPNPFEPAGGGGGGGLGGL